MPEQNNSEVNHGGITYHDFYSRLASLEKSTVKMESVLESNCRMLSKIESTLETLTEIQIKQAQDRVEFEARVQECKVSLERAHKRIDKVEGNLTWAIRAVISIVIASIMAGVGLAK